MLGYRLISITTQKTYFKKIIRKLIKKQQTTKHITKNYSKNLRYKNNKNYKKFIKNLKWHRINKFCAFYIALKYLI